MVLVFLFSYSLSKNTVDNTENAPTQLILEGLGFQYYSWHSILQAKMNSLSFSIEFLTIINIPFDSNRIYY